MNINSSPILDKILIIELYDARDMSLLLYSVLELSALEIITEHFTSCGINSESGEFNVSDILLMISVAFSHGISPSSQVSTVAKR